jgi:hypothetical protein
MLRRINKVKYDSFVQDTKSKKDGPRDRVMVATTVSMSETKQTGYYEEQKRAPQMGKRRSILNPLSWFG